jgi:hypothetical protein
MAHAEEGSLKKSIVIAAILMMMAAFPSACKKKNSCLECTDWSTCPALTKQCPGWTMTVQQCSGGCCTTDPAQLSCTAAFQGQILREEIIGDLAVIRIANGSERTTVFLSGRENGWVTAAMPESEVRCVMEGKLSEIRAMVGSLE